ncbi:CaiB/BaiF CoA transferase family protein [Limimaricola pyoseonensis]|uniref:Crotonobetainyl-CoA:carnitine CoA-transferase CaiB n=1 Tax=Limimaricola pyoseonensis TaxID=521013 RepID=A0A1G7IJX8_9RHOB|nr:CoA transferase [Limimaricola pyoseonensis]SDF12868.1 Crotonobetainyl-CoA:carnitine CoA-transferase CaiB [Limimaricola pyoseonensis]
MSWAETDWQPGATGPLSGLRVLDLSRLVAGNMTSLQMADFGADVVKVEPIPAGDPLRAWKQAGVPSFWKVYGRNKRSLGLDFRDPAAGDVLRRLIAGSDVVIENFRPGTLERMGLAPDDLLARHPQLVLLRVSGFGQSGPYSRRPGFGTLIEAMSGFAARNGEPEGPPLLPPLALADMIAGLYGAHAVAMALRARDAGQGGQVIDLSLLEAMTSVLGPEALDQLLTGVPKPRVGNGSNTSSPRNAYRTRDGAWIAVSGSMQSMAERLFHAIGRADMVDDPRFRTNADRVAHRAEVDAAVAAWFAERDRDEALALMDAAGVTAAPIYDSADIARDPHFRDRGVYVALPDGDTGASVQHSPLPRMSATPGSLRRPAPGIGEDGAEILSEIGFSPDEIANLRKAGTIA